MQKIIITTDKKTFAVYDLKTKKQIFVKKPMAKLQSPHLKKSGRPPFRGFGMDYDQDNLYLATHDKIAVFDRKSYKYKGLMPLKSFVNTHQILKDKNTFYITNTANDTIGIFDLKSGKSKYLDIKKFKIIDHAQETKSSSKFDKHHVNSLCLHEGKIYFCLNNKGDLPSGYYVYDPKTENTKHLASAGLFGHGIVILGNYLYTLSTGTCQLLRIHLKSKKVKSFNITEESIFLRGLALHKGKLIIGNCCDFQEEVRAYISEFDPKTERVKRLVLLEKFGIIYDLKILP